MKEQSHCHDVLVFFFIICSMKTKTIQIAKIAHLRILLDEYYEFYLSSSNSFNSFLPCCGLSILYHVAGHMTLSRDKNKLKVTLPL